MNPKILRTILTWAAPIIITYLVKKFEDRQAKKKSEPGSPMAVNK